MRRWIVLVIVLGASTALAQESEASFAAGDSAVRQSIEKSLPYLEAKGRAWMEERQCVSCHQVPFMLWSHGVAWERGLAVDEEKLNDWRSWSVGKLLSTSDEGEIVGTRNIDGLSQLILARALPSPGPRAGGALEEFLRLIARGQADDGSWNPAGQLPLQRRPQAETRNVSSSWNLLALASVDPLDREVATSRKLAWERVRDVDVGKSNESLVVKLLVEHRLGDPMRARSLLDELLQRQQPDGGWSWLGGEKSDALATGQSLFALSIVGMPSDQPVIQRARAFLVETQEGDGSWRVPSTLERKKGKPVATSNYWGTAWATIGLATTLPRKRLWF